MNAGPEWIILFTSESGAENEWESFFGTADEAWILAQRDNRHMNYGHNGFRIVPVPCVAGQKPPTTPRLFTCSGCAVHTEIHYPTDLIPNRWSVRDGEVLCGNCTAALHSPPASVLRNAATLGDGLNESEQKAWDRYAAAALLKLNYPPVSQLSDMAGSAAQVAEAMLTERRKRFPI